MRAWLAFLTRNRLLEIALALALGTAAFQVAESFATIAVTVLSQHVGSNPYGDASGQFDPVYLGPVSLNFNVADTIVIYGQILVEALTLGLIALGALWVIRRRDRELGECPFCSSRISYESTHCAYCGSGVSPAEL
jgi:hypothetical protein